MSGMWEACLGPGEPAEAASPPGQEKHLGQAAPQPAPNIEPASVQSCSEDSAAAPPWAPTEGASGG